MVGTGDSLEQKRDWGQVYPVLRFANTLKSCRNAHIGDSASTFDPRPARGFPGLTLAGQRVYTI